MTKRSQWILTCVLFAGMWLLFGFLFPPFWFLTVVSLLMIIVPVGVDNHPAPKHDPNKWGEQ